MLPPQTRADPTARRDLSLLLERRLQTKGTVALTRAEARELAGLRGSAAWQYVPVPGAVKFSGLAALFAAGFLAAGVIVSGGRAQDTTTTETTVETTTAPGTTATVERTTTRRVIVPTTSTTESPSNAENGTPTWVWVLLGILALGLVALLVVLLTRRGGEGISGEERQLAQGWAVENQTADSAVLRRGGDLMLVTVDQAGHVSTRPLPAA